jgi:hypothetical protein
MQDFEKLGSFYLGRKFDFNTGQTQPDTILYDAKDLTTHAVCVGMTGSGKTGLAISLLEEAAIDGIPAIAIDPKGDLGNLMLTFPNLDPADFAPWIDPSEAARKGRSPAEQAKWTSELWRKGLAEWGQGPERISLFTGAVDRCLYTPGSTAGRPLAVLRSLSAPGPQLLKDPDALRDRILGAVSGLLALLGISADPLRSREHILLSTLLDQAWREGRDLDLPALIRAIQKPPIERVGVFDLESFYPEKDRFELAMTLNNLLASPGFSVWTHGEPLDVQRLLYTPEGRPKLSILSIAHLSDSERMFLVTILLNEVLSWMRSQSGSSSLRAILYMDEIFGYFPPTANPPSKTPMLTLLKQARAYGLGIVLATQNPVDLDYKGLSNTGTWLLGRLQTERDKMRVMEGLAGASSAAGKNFDQTEMERTLSGLGNRVFLLNNVHEDEPVLFQTRWALSYLAGPLSREQIGRLIPSDAPPAAAAPPATAVVVPPSTEQMAAVQAQPPAPPVPSTPEAPPEAQPASAARPVLPPEVSEKFLPPVRSGGPGTRLVYRPALLGVAMLHYSNSRMDLDQWERVAVLAGFGQEGQEDPWAAGAGEFRGELSYLETEPLGNAAFEEVPASALNSKTHDRWKKMLASFLYRGRPLRLYQCPRLKESSQPGIGLGDFRARLAERVREQRDLEVEKLRKKYAAKYSTLETRLRSAQERVEREKSQYQQQTLSTAVSVGSTLLGALFGRKLSSRTSMSSVGTAVRGIGRSNQQRDDVGRAQESVEQAQRNLAELEAEFQSEAQRIQAEFTAENLEIAEVDVTPRKSDIAIEQVCLLWLPWAVDRTTGIAQPLFAEDRILPMEPPT